MAKNLCTPQRVFGTFSHYLFLGCSVRSFSSQIGWNEQVSELDVSLVQDTCRVPPGKEPKIYFDEDLFEQTTDDADPGFTYPIIGSPVYFRVEGFEFSGLVQSYEETGNEGGNPTFSVKIVDPRVVLEGTQLILSDYAGSVYATSNILNIYGFLESFGQKCPLTLVNGAYFGSPADAFGGAAINDNGIQWNKVKDAISVLTSAIPTLGIKYSYYGRLVYRGSDSPGYGSMKSDLIDVSLPLRFPNQTAYQALYLVDLSEIPNAPEIYRLAGTNMSLLECISTVCEDAGCDYYVTLVPIRLGATILKIIKIRISVRGSQPTLGSIALFVEDAGNVISKSVGRELRNEPNTQFIFGGQVESIYQVEDPTLINPYWGLDREGNIIPTFFDENDRLNFTVDLTVLNTLLYTPLNIDEAIITEYELQAALTGQDAWLAMASSIPSDLGLALNLNGVVDAQRVLNVLARVDFAHHLIVPGAVAGPVAAANFNDFENENNKMKDLETIYNFVLNYAREFYGKRFIVRVPYTCARIEDESQQVVTSESPSDSGWTEHPTVIGLANPLFMDLFKDDANKVVPFVKFSSAKAEIEISNVQEEDYILIESEDDEGEDTSQLFLRAQIGEPEFVYENFEKKFNAHVVIDLSMPMLERLDDNDFHRTKEFVNKFFILADGARAALALPPVAKPANMNDLLTRAGSSLLNLGIFSVFKKPDAVAVPIRNNVLTYGPWIANGPPGQSRVQKDDGLVPWEYGSVKNMNTAGNEKVNEGVTYLQVTELGNVTIPGYPALHLGDELRFGGPSALENRNLSTEKFEFTLGGSKYKGKWDATSGSPDNNPSEGDYYVVSKNGTTTLDGNTDWTTENVAVFVNGKWEQQTKPNNMYVKRTEGAWLGNFGPNITNINCEIGEGGITTTYSMRTYTPKFGRFSKGNSDRLKEYSRLIGDAQKRSRLAFLSELKISLNRKKLESKLFSNRLGNPASVFAASPPGVLLGQIVENEDELRSTAVYTIKHNELIGEINHGYANKALMSLDGMFRPVSRYGSGGLPQYVTYSPGCVTNIPVRPEPPLNSDSVSYSNLNITQQFLDPWVGPDDLKYADDLDGFNGHDIDIIGRGETVPGNLSIPLDELQGGGYTDDYRGFALKGPILLQQPGFDLQGKPVPNSADDEDAASVGVFSHNGLRDTFLPGFMRKPHTWPVAPIDLRLDRERGVWVAPQPYRMVRVVLNEKLQSEGSEGLVIDGNSIEDATGVTKEKLIKVFPLSKKQAAAEGDIIMAEYDTVSCKYRVIEAPSDSSGISVGRCLTNWDDGQQTDTYNTVSVAELDGVNGDPTGRIVDVKLLRYNKRFHRADILRDDLIAYGAVQGTEADEPDYIALSDYSRTDSIFMAYSLSPSLPLNGFADFTATVSAFADDSSGDVIVKNRLRQPIKENVCCLVYRRNGNNLVGGSHYYLMQAIFTQVCVVTKITIRTLGNSIHWCGHKDGDCYVPGGGSDSTFFDKGSSHTAAIRFDIQDISLYTQSAHQINVEESDQTSLYSDIDIDVRYKCCSSYTEECSVNAQVDVCIENEFEQMALTNSCQSSAENLWTQDQGGGCIP